MFSKTYTAEILTYNGNKIPAYTVTAPNHKKAVAAIMILMEDAPAAAKANVSAIRLTDSKGREIVWSVKA